MSPKRQRAAEAGSRKSERPDASGFVHVVRWNRVTEVDEYDWQNLRQIETCGHSVNEAIECVMEEINGIEGLSTDVGGASCGACKTVGHALSLRNSTLERLVQQAQAGVQEALGCSKATYDRLKKKDWIVEFCDATFLDGDTAVDLTGVSMDPPNPGQEEDESKFWWRRSSERLRNSIAHQVHYAVHWGGPERTEKGCNCSELVDATECVVTHVRVWIESMPLLAA